MKKWIVVSGIVLLLGLFCYFQNNALVTTKLEIESSKIPEAFNGYRIVQLSDLHGKSFGSNQDRLIQRVKESKPDLIVFTGDLVDSKRYDSGPGLTLLKELSTLAPVYIISGNHEWWSGRWEELREEVGGTGAVLLEDDAVTIKENEEEIGLLGVDDPAGGDVPAALQSVEKKKGFKILLSHRPELFSDYAASGMDLVLSGHAHGGQVRLPFIGGLVAPDQGMFPEYTEGLYKDGDTNMVVNRGLGNSIIPLRIFNRPEVVEITLLAK
ncbi:phosphoesterase [Rossellomorea marisflavi]|uniref:metallophosphoesterase n=1 Tax=Rossellomorea marisflavi TaxID=189381 RepID=UPI0025C8CEBD|nr:metallophosphoesterase [Rossellomorea marisflavi]GLI85416.1 phosphoesterase [Rossellomorea marisflavi]